MSLPRLALLPALLLGLSAVGLSPAARAATTAPPTAADCSGWHDRVLASGLGSLENALAEPSGSVVVSDLSGGRLLRVTPGGTVWVLTSGLASPGGLARRGGRIAVTTGDDVGSALLGRPDGGISLVDPATGVATVWASGLVSPNGLAVLADGSAVTTRTIDPVWGTRSEVTRTTGDPAAPQRMWSDLTSTNGAAVGPDGAVYLSRSFSGRAEIWRLDPASPAQRTLVADLGIGALTALDDLTVTPDGAVYVAADAAGGVFRVDPVTGATCHPVTGIPLASSVEAVSGADGRPQRLYVTTLTGDLHELTR